MNLKDIRWKQRFQNFLKAFTLMKEAIDAFDTLSDLEKEGLVLRFEYTFELAWKTLKDFLEAKGVELSFPRDVIKEGFSTQIIANGEVWIEMLDNRNLTAHTYEEKIFKEVLQNIRTKYYSAIAELITYLEKEI
ncbi:MAG: nucleotidyltransferase substrate binding protein [Bacteroidota bacterium]